MRCEIVVEFANLTDGFVHLNDGTDLPIVRMLDADGEDCDDTFEAVAVVAGTDGFGWLAISLTSRETLH